MRCKSYLLNEFCRKNKIALGTIPKSVSDYIVINHISTELSYLVIQDDIMAHFLRNESKCKIAAITLFPDENAKKIDESYDIDSYDINLEKVSLLNRILIFALSFFSLIGNKQKKIVGLKYKGIRLGDCIYEYIQGHKIYQGKPDMKNLSVWKDLHYIYDCLILAEKTLLWSREKSVKYIVTQEINVSRGIPTLVLLARGAEVVIADWYQDSIKIKNDGKKTNNYTRAVFLSDIMKTEMENIKDVPQGDDFVVDFEQGGGRNRLDLLNEIGIKKDGYNVFIMLHCFDDSCRTSFVRDIFYDYYEWYINTLRIISKIKDNNINWIIRNHPLEKRYRQDVFPKEDFNKYKSDNMYYLDGSIGGYDLLQIADCVVTDCGDAGMEYVAHGIPSLYTGYPFYSNYDVGTKANNEKEYIYWLNNIRNIAKPGLEEMRTAKKLILVTRNRYEIYDDPISKYIGYASDAYVKSSRWRVDNNSIIENYLPLLTNENLNNSGYAVKAKILMNENDG